MESVLFLLRRAGHKETAYSYLKETIKEKIPLGQIMSLFNYVNSVYRSTALMRKNDAPVANRRSLDSSRNRARTVGSISNDIISPSGETVML